jgi:hypothetical protein
MDLFRDYTETFAENALTLKLTPPSSLLFIPFLVIFWLTSKQAHLIWG